MNEKEIKRIVAMYFGFTPSMKGERMKINLIEGRGEKIKIKWEEHIGNLSGVARISPLDLMYEMNMENNIENYEKAVEMLRAAAGKDMYLVEVKGKYLLINPKYRR